MENTLVDKEKFFGLVKDYYDSKKYDSYLDALTDFVEDNDIDIETVDHFINDNFKAILKKEALEKNLLKTTKRRKK